MLKKESKKESLVSVACLTEQLCLRLEELEAALQKIDSFRKDEPEGSLRVSMVKPRPQYYQVIEPNDTTGKYIRKRNWELAAKLAQKNYNNNIEKAIREEIGSINVLLNNLTNSPESIFENLIEPRKRFVTPILETDKTYKAAWINEAYEKNRFYPEELIYETKSGEMVRSKSEMMIADVYCELEIPYRYEAKLVLDDGNYKYPDFTALDVKHRRVVYHEHFGLINDEAYRISNMHKLDVYRNSGIYLGKNLIITYEAEESPLNIRAIKRMLADVFLDK